MQRTDGRASSGVGKRCAAALHDKARRRAFAARHLVGIMTGPGRATFDLAIAQSPDQKLGAHWLGALANMDGAHLVQPTGGWRASFG